MYATLKKGDTFYDIGIPSFQEEKFHEYWQEDHRRRIKLGLQCNILFNKGTPQEVLENRNSFWGCDARYMPVPVETPSWIMVYKDVTAIILQSGGCVVIEIKNEEIAESFKEYFHAFWKLTRPFK